MGDDQGTRLPRKFLKTCCITNQCKKLNIEQFGTRYIRRKTRATSLEEERIKKLVNAGDLNYLIQLGNSPDYHEMVEYCLELKRGSFKSCKKSKRRYDRLQLLFMLDREDFQCKSRIALK